MDTDGDGLVTFKDFFEYLYPEWTVDKQDMEADGWQDLKTMPQPAGGRTWSNTCSSDPEHGDEGMASHARLSLMVEALLFVSSKRKPDPLTTAGRQCRGRGSVSVTPAPCARERYSCTQSQSEARGGVRAAGPGPCMQPPPAPPPPPRF